MSWFTAIIVVLVAIIYIVALIIVWMRENDEDDANDALFLEAKKKIRDEYFRSLRLSEEFNNMKTKMDWHD